MKIKEWIQLKKNFLPIEELYYFLKAILGVEYIDMECDLKEIVQKSLDIGLKKRIDGVPLAKIIEKKAFYNHDFITNEHTLDPRPETEFLIEKIKDKPKKILELGVGTGCLILSILKKFPKARALGVDISKEAIAVAMENADILQLTNKVEWKINNWAFGVVGHFDLIVSNPPYLLKEEKLSSEVLCDPAMALFGDINTYIQLMESLSEITFRQILLEVPKFLLNEFLSLYDCQYKIDYFNIYNSDIYCVDIGF